MNPPSIAKLTQIQEFANTLETLQKSRAEGNKDGRSFIMMEGNRPVLTDSDPQANTLLHTTNYIKTLLSDFNTRSDTPAILDAKIIAINKLAENYEGMIKHRENKALTTSVDKVISLFGGNKRTPVDAAKEELNEIKGIQSQLTDELTAHGEYSTQRKNALEIQKAYLETLASVGLIDPTDIKENMTFTDCIRLKNEKIKKKEPGGLVAMTTIMNASTEFINKLKKNENEQTASNADMATKLKTGLSNLGKAFLSNTGIESETDFLQRLDEKYSIYYRS